MTCWSWATHSCLPVPAGRASVLRDMASQSHPACWLEGAVRVTRCCWWRGKELKEDVGHIFLKFLITDGLWHDATGKVDSASGLVMPCAYYSSVVGFQQLANCECLSLDSHPNLPRGWEEPLTAARRRWVGRAGAQTNYTLIPSRERGVMPAVRDGDSCQAGVCRPGGYPERACLYFCQCWPCSPK